MSAARQLLDEDLDHVRAEDAELDLRQRESEYYRLIRRAFVGQANGDFDLGSKLQEAMRDVEEPLTEAEFDACMSRALAAMPAEI